MIDYENLKLAHELADKLAKKEKIAVLVSVYLWAYDQDPVYKFRLFDGRAYEYVKIDDLITKLKELTRPEPKYKSGDIVWTIYDQKPLCFVIEEVNYRSNNKFMYRLSSEYPGAAFEENLYPTKSALIQAQIEHWTKLREQEDKL